MMQIIKLLEIIKKNLKIVFRSWTTTFLLIIAPLLLIALLGYAFGGNDVHDIKLGAYSENYEEISDIVKTLESPQIDIIHYVALEDCVLEIKKDNVHVCAEFSSNFRITNQGAKGTITFYLDNSKLNLLSYLTEYINKKVGIKTDQITLEATEKILGDIQESVVFMQDTKEKLDEFIESAVMIKSQLVTTKKTVENIKSEFDKVYTAIKIAERLGYVERINNTANNFTVDTEAINISLNAIKQNMIVLEQIISLFENTSVENKINLTAMQEMLNTTKESIEDVQSKIVLYNTITEQNKQYTSFIPLLTQKLDETNLFLETMLNETDKNIVVMDKALEDMYTISRQLDTSIEKFSGLDKNQASSLLKPITTLFKPLLQDKTKITLIFPVVLVFIILFISILLSNITTLKDVHSQANFRNYLVPVANFSFIFGLYITNLLVVLFQIAILLFVAIWRFNIRVIPVAKEVLITTFLVTTVFILVGMCIGYIVKSQQTSILLSVFVALAAFLFSDVIFPVEIMPELAAKLASINPLVIGERMFRKLFYYTIPLEQQMQDISIMIIYILVLSFLTYLGYRYNKRKC